MSYSFNIAAATKPEANSQIREQFDAVVAAQPPHAADKEAAVVAAQTLVNLLADPKEGETIRVSMSGSLSWRGEDYFIAAGLNISVGISSQQ